MRKLCLSTVLTLAIVAVAALAAWAATASFTPPPESRLRRSVTPATSFCGSERGSEQAVHKVIAIRSKN